MLRKPLFILTLILVSLLLSFSGISNFFYDDDGEIYKKIKVSPKDRIYRPVLDLMNNIKSGDYHLVNRSFIDEKTSSRFFSKLDSTKFKLLGRLSWEKKNEVNKNSLIQISYKIFHPSHPKAGSYEILFDVVYSDKVKQYLINNFSLSDSFYEDFVISSSEENYYVDDDINPFDCPTRNGNESVFIRLRSKEENRIKNEKILGKTPVESIEYIGDNEIGANALAQIPFDVRNVEDHSYDPGYVVSAQDAVNNDLGRLFSTIVDSDGILTVSDSKGVKRTFPAGFFLDKATSRLFVLTNSNEIFWYGRKPSDHLLGQPIAISVIGNYIYVLDRKKASIAIYRIDSPSGTSLSLSFKVNSDFQLDLTSAVDIDGHEGDSYNYLYLVRDSYPSLYRLKLDKNTGLPIESKPILNQIDQFGNQEIVPSNIIRIETIRGNEEGSTISMAITDTRKVISFAFKEDNGKVNAQINTETVFRVISELSNVGFHVLDKTFYVTDAIGKVHVFSQLGKYLGTGGKPGQSEHNVELYYPNIITSNFFADNAMELVVGSAWTTTTGFKRVTPIPVLSGLEVLEFSSIDPQIYGLSSLYLRYRLNTGTGVNAVKGSINNTEIFNTASPFAPGLHTQIIDLHDASVKTLIKEGWNTYSVEIQYQTINEYNQQVSKSEVKTIEFYYLPSNVTVVNGLIPDILKPNTNGLIELYKSLYVSGEGSLSFDSVRVKLSSGAHLEFDEKLNVFFTDCSFDLSCNARVIVNAHKDYHKEFISCSFNGNSSAENLVQVKGEYTGGKGYQSAPSSKVEFINCDFQNYDGKAIHIVEGRATIVNSVFDSNKKVSIANSSGILVSPGARVDAIGCSFYNHDIGVESTLGEVVIGSHRNTYKSLEVAPSIFSNNQIGVFGYASYLRIEGSAFQENNTGISSLEGFIDISKKANNTFSQNSIAILSSNDVDAERGFNTFSDNGSDVFGVLNSLDPLKPFFELSCNIWESNGKPIVSGVYVDDLSIDNPSIQVSELISYSPTATLHQNTYKCGGKDIDYSFVDDDYIRNQGKRNAAYASLIDNIHSKTSQLNQLFSPVGDFAQYGYYGSKEYFYKDFSYKNLLGAILYNKRNYDSNSSYYAFKDDFKYRKTLNNSSINITKDRVEFLKVLQNYQTHFNSIDKQELQIVVYPNPVVGKSFTAKVNSPTEGRCKVYLADVNGKSSEILFNGRYLTKGDNNLRVKLKSANSGMYILVIQMIDKNVKGSQKVIIN